MIELTIYHKLFSKARPRVTKHGTFMPVAYKKNQKEMLEKIKEQYDGLPLEGPLRIEIQLWGEGRADIDNIIGAFFDTANKVLWVDDRVSVIPQVTVSWTKATKAESRWLIRIYEIEPESSQLSL